MDRKLVASGPLDALEDASVDLRARMPDVFAKVDAIKNASGWTPFSAHSIVHGPTDSSYRMVECAWCGDDFVAMFRHGRFPQCCQPTCTGRYHAWKVRRARPAA